MPNKVTVKLEVKFDGGPTVKPKDQEIWVQSYTPNLATIDADKMWHEVVIDGGKRSRLELLLMSVKEPAGNGSGNGKCPSQGPVLFKFGNKPEGTTVPEPKDIFELNAPQFFAGHTIGLLPDEVNVVSFQNLRSEKVDVEILFAKKTEDAMKAKPPLVQVVPVPVPMKP